MQQIPKTANQCESAVYKYKMYMKINSKDRAWCKLEKTQYIRHRHGLGQGTTCLEIEQNVKTSGFLSVFTIFQDEKVSF
jgi:hypothetical protein